MPVSGPRFVLTATDQQSLVGLTEVILLDDTADSCRVIRDAGTISSMNLLPVLDHHQVAGEFISLSKEQPPAIA